MQIAPNFGCGQPFTQVRQPVRSGGALIANLLRNCRRFFYIEDQYGVGNPDLADAISHAFANGARYGVVVLATSAGNSDLPEIGFRRWQFWSRFPQTGRNLFVFERLGDGFDRRPGPHAYVHSKLMVVDDLAASIGSMNMNRRSWYCDSELTALVTDAPELIRDLRVGIWRTHLKPSATADVPDVIIRDPEAARSLWLGARLGAAPRLVPVSFRTEPPRKSAEIAYYAGLAGAELSPALSVVLGGSIKEEIRSGIDQIMDVAYATVFDPISSC